MTNFAAMRRYFVLLLMMQMCGSLASVAQTTVDTLYSRTINQAYEALEHDSLLQAEDLFRSAMRLRPSSSANAVLFANIGRIQRELGRNNEALESFTLSLNIAPHAVPVLMERGNLNMLMDNQDKAYTDYSNVLDLCPEDTTARLYRAYILMNKGDYKSARIDYNYLLSIDANSYRTRLGLAILNQKSGRLQEALTQISALIIGHPTDPTLYGVRANMEEENNQFELAELDWEEAHRLAPDDKGIEQNLQSLRDRLRSQKSKRRR